MGQRVSTAVVLVVFSAVSPSTRAEDASQPVDKDVVRQALAERILALPRIHHATRWHLLRPDEPPQVVRTECFLEAALEAGWTDEEAGAFSAAAATAWARAWEAVGED